MPYDAFLSYSHSADRLRARILQITLERFAKKWYRRQALSLFRDEINLQANPHLWDDIVSALRQSRFFILLASPEAAKSHWVPKEVDFWLDPVNGKDRDHILLVRTGGQIEWDDEAQDFDWDRTNALPLALAGKFTSQPLWVDLAQLSLFESLSVRLNGGISGTNTKADSSVPQQGKLKQTEELLARVALADGEFGGAVATLAAALHGRSRRELWGEDLRQHLRLRQILWGGVAALALAAVFSTCLAVLFGQQREEARQQASVATRAESEASKEASVAVGAEADAKEKANIATRETALAKKQREIALFQRARAEEEARVANQQSLLEKSEANAAEQQKGLADQRRHIADDRTKDAVYQAHLAREQSDRSLAVQLSAQARGLTGQNDQRSLLLAVEAVHATSHQAYVVPTARAALQDAVSRVSGVGLCGHRDMVELASFSDDERTLATASFDKEARVWDISQPNEPHCTSILGLPDFPKAVIFDHTGRNLLTLSGAGSSRTAALIWRIGDRRRYPSSTPLSENEPPDEEVAASHSLVAVAGTDGQIRLISRADFSCARVVRILETPEGMHSPSAFAANGNDIEKLAFSRDGQILLAGTNSSRVWIWDLNNPGAVPVTDIQTGSGSRSPEDESGRIDLIGISNDHTILYGGSSRWFKTSANADLNLRIWHLKSLTPTGPPILLPHKSAPNSSAIQTVTFSADNSRLVTISLDGRLRSWQLSNVDSNQTPVATLYAETLVNSMAMSPGGTMIAFDSGRQVRLLRTSDLDGETDLSKAVSLTGFDGDVSFVRYSGSGRFLVAGGLDDTVRLWDTWREDPAIHVPSDRPSPYDAAIDTRLSKDGRMCTILKSDRLEFWSLRNPALPTLMRSVKINAERFGDFPESVLAQVLVAPDQHWVAIQSVEPDKADIVELTPRGRSFQVDARVWISTHEIEFSPDSRWLLVQKGQGEEVFNLDVKSPAMPSETVVNLPSGEYSRDLSPDGRYVLYRRDVNSYNDITGRSQGVGVVAPLAAVNDLSRRRTISGFAVDIESSAFSEDGEWLAMAGEQNFRDRSKDDTFVKLVRLRGDSAEFSLSGGEVASDPTFSAHGNWLLTASSDITLEGTFTQARLWHLNGAGTRAPIAQILPGITTHLHTCEFSPDGRFLVTISGGGPTARLWKLSDRATLLTTLDVPVPRLNWHYMINFSGDGKKLVIADTDDPTPYLWSLDRAQVQSRGLPIPNGDRAIQSMTITPNSESLVILNSGETATAVSGSTGSHVTVVDLKTFPREGSSYQVLDSPDEANAVVYRDDLGLILTQGNSIRGQSIRLNDVLVGAKRALGRNITLDEWTKAEINKIYQPTFPDIAVDWRTLRTLPGVVAELSDEHRRDAAATLIKNLTTWTTQLDEADICNDVAWQLNKQHDGRAALTCITRGLKYFPTDAQYRDTQGVAFALLGRRKDAIADFKYFIRMSGLQESPEEVRRRQMWIDYLRTGKYPFIGGLE